MKQVTNFESECIYAAIGWLAREGNISFDNGSKGPQNILRQIVTKCKSLSGR
ncbi:MAG: winged helix-turn-helix domain-containing protein [Muribaculaceae bacterium]